MTDRIVWVNDYALNEDLLGDGPRIFVFDPEVMAAQHVGLKRLSMIHRRLLELECTLVEGRCAEVLAPFAEVCSFAVPCPYWRRAQRSVAEVTELHLLPLPVFIEPPKPPKLKRFMGFWKPIEKIALDPGSWN